jgi:predicted negative regulator of RcsB-dependent stress response
LAKYKKKRARELQHDRFRDTAMILFDRFGNQLEGRGRVILYGLAGIALVALLSLLFIKWNHRKTDEAQRALGRAITIATTPVSSGSPDPASPANPTTPTFSSELERAQKSVEEFQKVAAKYGEPYHSEARYLAATNLLVVDRNKGFAELAELSKTNNVEVAALAKFALAQAHEADAKYEEAAQLYRELAASGSQVVTTETANLRLALVYAKQGKKKEASDLLFNIVDASRKAKGSDQLPLPPSSAASKASEELQKLDPERYAQLPEPPAPV